MNALNGTTARLRRLLPQSLEEAVPAVGVARRYERSSLRSDVIAGAIVAVVAVPSSLAMGELAGLPVVFGLYATFLPLVGYAISGSSRHVDVGRDATMAAIPGCPCSVRSVAVDGRWSDSCVLLATGGPSLHFDLISTFWRCERSAFGTRTVRMP